MKKFRHILFLVAMMFIFAIVSPNRAFADDASITNNENGTIRLSFNNTYSEKIKLLVQLTGGKMFKYDIPKGNVNVNIPLTEGNGEYKIILAKNISGTRYSVLQTSVIKLSVSSSTSPYLTSNIIIDWDTTNKAVKKAQQLTKGKSGNSAKFKAVYNYVVKNYSYDYDKLSILDSLSKDGSYIPNIDSIYSSKKGICYDISIMMASMLRSVDVPTKVVTGYTPNAANNQYHAWNNVYISSWKIVDATYDMQMYKAGKKYSTYKPSSQYKTIVYTY
ncbi:MAG: transglutaminase-like domain-containing protein [Catonella sp.]|jgi:transglutaminase-like putative cysteine protease|nr:transglutaminase-like domain-containing protein [Catonella sp.]MDY6357579.1 transglutaminase-like domain-containing protein [Catonella sp.]